MKIAIDATQIVYGTGVSVYTKNLVSHLLEIDHTNEYILFAGSLRRRQELEKILLELRKGITVKVNRMSPRLADLIWNRIHTLPIEYLIGKIDVLHTSDWTEPPSSAYKVTTIHDLSPLIVPNETPRRIIPVFERKLKWVYRESKKIIVPTETTKKDLVKRGFKEDRIVVIKEGLTELFTKKHSLSMEVANRYDLSGRYILCLGTALRKNTSRVSEAFRKLKEEKVVDKMVVVGEKPKETEEGIVYTGFVPNRDLPEIFAGASVLVYASLYEGFGLPILEGFSQDCPVVTSNLGSMKEVAGEAASLVDPFEVSSIKRGIWEAINNRKAFTKLGHTRLNDFSWDKAARETLKVYENSKQ